MNRAALACMLCLSAAACSGPSALSGPCDIRTRSCQNDIFVAVQGLRDGAWDPWLDLPPMRVITQDQYRAELAAQQAARQTAEQSYDYFTPAYEAFALYDPNEGANASVEFSVQFAAAFYSAATQNVTIIDRGNNTNQRNDCITLAHELVHAAQDRDVSFGQIDSWIHSVDSANATGALVEGEAVLYQDLFALQIAPPPPPSVVGPQGIGPPPKVTIDWDATYAERTNAEYAVIEASASPLREASAGLRYPLGGAYMNRAWRDGGPLAVRRAFAAHPESTLPFTLGRSAVYQLAEIEASAAHDPCHPPAAPDGFELKGQTSLGTWGLFAFATRFATTADLEEVAKRLAADQFAIFADGDNNLAIVWQLRFADDDANLFWNMTQGQLPSGVQERMAQSDDSTLVLFATRGAANVSDWAWDACGTGD